MSILKGILHHWNKTTKSYDTIHPETEVAQITNWNQGIVNTLASTALGTLVNTLTSDSLLATMIQKVLTATGVKYSMGQNGYICLGSLFGGLIIQWGILSNGTLIFPITLSQVFSVVALKNRDHGGGVPNLIATSNTFVKIELEWAYGGQHTSMSNGVNAVVFGK